MVEAFEAATRSELADPLEDDHGATGLDRLRRLVFSARSDQVLETGATDADPEPGPAVDETRPQSDPKPPPSFAGPAPRSAGQLHDAQPVTPALRLGYRGDARTLREAAAEVAATQHSPRIGAR